MRLRGDVFAVALALLAASCGVPGGAGPPAAAPPSLGSAPAASGGQGGAGPPSSSPAAVAPPSPPPLPALAVTDTVTLHLPAPPADSLAVTLADVAFSSAQDGAAVGYRCGGAAGGGSAPQCSGVVLTTSDGGSTWAGPTAVAAPLTSVRFLAGSAFGWAWGPGALYTTTDGGTDWTPSVLPTPQAGEPVIFASFADPRDGWLAIGDANCATQGCPIWLWSTSDAGATWRQVASNMGDITPQGGLAQRPPNGLPWAEWDGGGDLGGGRGWLLSNRPAGAVFVTSDGGTSWTGAAGLESGGTDTAAALTAGGAGWASGWVSEGGVGSSAVVATADGGTTWRAIGSLPGDVLSISAAPDGGSAWALLGPAGGVGTGLAVLGAAGAGAVEAAPSAYGIDAVAALSATSAWAVATGPWQGYGLLQTTDGGGHWTLRYRMGSDVPAGRWGFWNATQGWAVGAATDPSAVLTTADRGASLSVTRALPTANVVSAGFPTPGFGWVVTGDGTVLISRDGGRSWSQAAQPAGAACEGIPLEAGFDTPSLGWMSLGASKGCAASFLVTVDGGAAWSEPAQPPPGTVWSAAFSASGAGWAVAQAPGGRAALAATQGGGKAWRTEALLSPSLADAPLSIDPAGGLWLGTTRSTDGGRTWTRYVVAPQGDAPSAIEFVSAAVGWVASGGSLYQTSDGGAQWRVVGAADPASPTG